jgi:cysteine-rich repeat protein
MRGSGLALAGSVALLVTLLHGCIVADLVDCGDGTACPRGTTCVAGACASPGQLTVCDGVSDGVSCIADRRTGACSGGVCTFALCGNQIVEPGEQCDDGNFVAGDGCTPDCKSNETCGNGVVDVNEQCDDGNLDDHDGCQSICVRQHCGDAIVDPGEVCDDGNLAAGDGCTPDCKSLEVCGNDVIDFFIAEVCDDGNTRNADGCAGTCQQHEARVWDQIVDTSFPPRTDAAFAYDAARERVVVFGGGSGTAVLADTWEWDGRRWQEIVSPTHPVARRGARMAYDANRHRVVLFGGIASASNASGAPIMGDTWEWDGARWSLLQPSASPPARTSHTMAYDGVRHEVVVFGGLSVGVSLGGLLPMADTWVWDGATWSPRAHLPPGPPRRWRSTR